MKGCPPARRRRGERLLAEARSCGALLVLTMALLLGLARVAGAAAPNLDESKLVDLTYTFDDKTIYWPTEDGFHKQVEFAGVTPGGYYYAANKIAAAEHGGTHMDAPLHFAEGHLAADAVPLSSLIAPAAVIDVSTAADKDRDYRLTVADLQAWEAKHGRLPDGAIVLLRSGWGRRWPDKEAYLGTAKPGDTGNLHFPGFSKEAAEWLLANRSIDAIGIDTASIDYGPSKDFIVHQTILGANKPAFENVANLDRLPEEGAAVIALPMKIGGGSGGPARIIALLP
jgi:kynurenine formamidase